MGASTPASMAMGAGRADPRLEGVLAPLLAGLL
jgi:hypothetical protein